MTPLKSSSAPIRLNPDDILKLIPERYQMVLLDGADLYPDQSRITGYKAVSLSEIWYAGTDEAKPGIDLTYPYSLLIGSLGQTAVALCFYLLRNTAIGENPLVLFARTSNIEFFNRVSPGNIITHRVRADYITETGCLCSGGTYCGRNKIAWADKLIVAIKTRTQLAEMKQNRKISNR